MNTGGPAVFLDHLTSAMNDLDTQSTIAYGYCESNEADYTENHKLNSDLINISSLHRSLNPFHDLKSFIKIRKMIKEIKPDLVNTHTSKAGVLGRLAAKSVNKKLPVVHTFHGHLIYGYFARYKTIVFTLVERFLARFTNAAISITSETQNSLQKLKIGKNLRWEVVHLGIPKVKNPVSSLNSGEKITLLWVGRFTRIKDPSYAVKVINELENFSPGKYELLMVGGGELLNEIKQEAMHLPITFTDWIEEPFKKIKYFDLLLLTSINEGMGMVILEAANLNRPTISRDVGGVKEFIADDKSGFLIDGGPEMMALKILQLSREEMYKVGFGARDLLEKDFTDINMAEKYSLIYQSLFKDFI